MKLKEVFYALGLKPKIHHYGFGVFEQQLPPLGVVNYAYWRHPQCGEVGVNPASVEAMRQIVSPGDFCIDIGAHDGDTTVPMALAVGKEGCVLALEPNPYVFPVLEKNSQLNPRLTNIVPLMAAASDTDGKATFYSGDSGICNGGIWGGKFFWQRWRQFQFEVETVDLAPLLRRDYADHLPKLSYLKVDAEGYDLPILNSLSGIVDEYRPTIRAEVFKHSDKEYRQSMFAFFADRGYRIHRLASEADLFGQQLDVVDMNNWPHFDIVGVAA